MFDYLDCDTDDLAWLDARAIASSLTGESRTERLDRLTQALLREGECDE